MEKIKLYSIYTDDNLALKERFVSSLKDDWEIELKHWDALGQDQCCFGRLGFISLMRKRTEYYLDVIKGNQGRIVIFSDIDIQFFGKCNDVILETIKDKDLLFQSEHWPDLSINGGFIVVRCNQKTIALYQALLDRKFEKLPFYEQTAMNDILKENTIGLFWGILPKQFWAKSHGGLPPLDILLHHANACKPKKKNGKAMLNLDLKLEQMNEVRCCVTRWRKFPWLLPIELVLREISIYLHKVIGFKFIYFKKKGFYGK